MARQSVSSRSCPTFRRILQIDLLVAGLTCAGRDVQVGRGLVQLQVFFTVADCILRSLGCWCNATGGAARLSVWYQHI